MRRNRAVPFCLFFFGGLTVPVTRGWGRQIEHTEKSRTLRARRGELGQKGNRPLRHRSPTHFPSVFTLIAVKRKDWKGRRQPKREREREREKKRAALLQKNRCPGEVPHCGRVIIGKDKNPG